MTLATFVTVWCLRHVAFVSSTALARCEVVRLGFERPAVAEPHRRRR